MKKVPKEINLSLQKTTCLNGKNYKGRKETEEVVVSYKPFFVTLKSIRIQGFDSYGETCTGLNRSSTVFLDPSFEDATKTSFSEKTLGSEVSGS